MKRIRELLASLFGSDPKRPGATPSPEPPPASPSDVAEPKGAGEPALDAPFEIVRVSGSDAANTWQVLRKRTGTVPVLLGNRPTTQRMLELPKLNQSSFESIRDLGSRLDVEEWIAERLREEPGNYGVDERCTDPVGDVPAFSPAFDMRTGKHYPEVFIGLIPVEEPWLVPAYLKFGGWNDYPDASVHVAFFKRWFERYGAVVTTVADDVIEFNVSRPPTTAEAARQLAMEQYVYCYDIVHQGVDTLGNLAATLRGSPNWYFWWD